MSYAAEMAVLIEAVNESVRGMGSGKEAGAIDLKNAVTAWEAEVGRPGILGKPHPYEIVDGMRQIGPWKIERTNLGEHNIRLSRAVSTEN